MEEVQQYWEVPVIAHFCHIFKATFDLFYFEIEDLELALLRSPNAEHLGPSIEQLAMRLLQGIRYPFQKKELDIESWEKMLHQRLSQDPVSSERHSELLKNDMVFSSLEMREKLQVLLSLCEMRLEFFHNTDSVKDMSSDLLRVEPIGMDSERNTYWYFFGVRLYKEDKVIEPPIGKKTVPASRKRKPKPAKPVVNGSRRSARRKTAVIKEEEEVLEEESSSSPSWTIVCRTLEDWETLAEALKRKSSSYVDQNLSRLIQKQYIPMLLQQREEKEMLEKQRLLDLAPRRASARIETCRKEKLAAIQKIHAIVEEKRLEEEMEYNAKAEADKEASKLERANRAKLRELRVMEGDNSNSCDANTFETAAAGYVSVKQEPQEQQELDTADPLEILRNGTSSSETWASSYSIINSTPRRKNYCELSDEDSKEEVDEVNQKEWQPSEKKMKGKKLKMPRFPTVKDSDVTSKKLPEVSPKISPHPNCDYRVRNFPNLSSLQFGTKGVTASITFNNNSSSSMRTYSRVSPFLAKSQLVAEQNASPTKPPAARAFIERLQKAPIPGCNSSVT